MRAVGVRVAAVLVLLGGCARAPTFKSHSYEVITTDAHMGELRSAISMTHQALGNWVENADGSKTDSSFSQSGKSWKDAKGRFEAARVRTEFRSKDGAHHVIEDVTIPGEPRIVLLSSDNDSATMELHNELVKCLGKMGVKPVKK